MCAPRPPLGQMLVGTLIKAIIVENNIPQGVEDVWVNMYEVGVDEPA